MITARERANSSHSTEQKWHDLKLWYDEPAGRWTEALPLGNGRLGAMVFSGIKNERLQLNEKSLWSGSPDDADNADALAALYEARRLIFEGKYAQANAIAVRKLVCKGAGSGRGSGANVPYGSYQTLGDLTLKFDGPNEANDYRRELDLDTAVARVSYRQGDVTFTREIFSSTVDQVLVVRLICDKPGRISFTAELTRPERFITSAEGADCLIMTGQMNDGKGRTSGLKYIVRLRAISDGGRISTVGSTLRTENANAVTLLLTASTNYKLQPPDYQGNPHEKITAAQLTAATAKPYNQLRETHIADYQKLFRRVWLELGCNTSIETDAPARGRFEVGITWANSKLTSATICSLQGNKCRIRTTVSLQITSGGRPIKTTCPKENAVEFDTKTGQTYLVSVKS